jgi:hypothetical protein
MINTSNYTLESLKFIQTQGSKNHEAVWAAFRELTNKSYTAIAVYGAIATKVFSDINASLFSTTPIWAVVLLVVLTILPIAIILSNLLPTSLSFAGSHPTRMINEYFENVVEETQEKELLSFVIEMQMQQITATKKVLKQRSHKLKLSIYFALVLLAWILIIHVL